MWQSVNFNLCCGILLVRCTCQWKLQHSMGECGLTTTGTIASFISLLSVFFLVALCFQANCLFLTIGLHKCLISLFCGLISHHVERIIGKITVFFFSMPVHFLVRFSIKTIGLRTVGFSSMLFFLLKVKTDPVFCAGAVGLC